jgi:hypothetical protein
MNSHTLWFFRMNGTARMLAWCKWDVDAYGAWAERRWLRAVMNLIGSNEGQ